MKHAFVKDQGYALKFTFKTRKVTLYFQGIRREEGEEPSYRFTVHPGDLGNNTWVTDAEIQSIEAPKAKKSKVKELKECDRCFGVGRFSHVAHVQGGICFKCGGAGKI